MPIPFGLILSAPATSILVRRRWKALLDGLIWGETRALDNAGPRTGGRPPVFIRVPPGPVGPLRNPYLPWISSRGSAQLAQLPPGPTDDRARLPMLQCPRVPALLQQVVATHRVEGGGTKLSRPSATPYRPWQILVVWLV